MKVLKGIVPTVLALVMVFGLGTDVYAQGRGRMWGPATAAQFYTADGIEVNWQGGFARNNSGNWTFGRGCWFLDDDGNTVNAWGTIIFDSEGNPVYDPAYGWGGCFGGGRRGWGW